MVNHLQSSYVTPDECQIMESRLNELIDIEIVSNHYACENSEIENVRQKMCQLRRAHHLDWAEQAALFYKLTATYRLKEEDERCTHYFDKAIALYQWMCEGSRYLHANHSSEIDEKRQEMAREIDNLYQLKETWHLIQKNLTTDYIDDIIGKLENSGYLYKYPSKVNIVINLLEHNTDELNIHIPVLIKIIYLLKVNNLILPPEIDRIEKILERHITLREKEIAGLWFSNAKEKLELQLKYNILETSALLLLAKENSGLHCPESILSARICRYLSRFESPYSDQLKNKAYTLLTGECTLNERLCWEDLLTFSLNDFIVKLVNIRIGELNSLKEIDENKWAQYSNGHNSLTLDRDGFTLSNLFPKPIRSWKGKKDRASVLGNRVFVVSFGKPTYLFDRCKSLTEHYLYWKQFQTEFPLYQLEPAPASATASTRLYSVIKEIQKQYPAIGDEVTIGIVKNNSNGDNWEGVILDKAFRGMKAVLPYALFNACYYRIDGFLQLISTNDSFKAKVVEVNPEGVTVSLIQSFNEFAYLEHTQKKQMPAMLAECEDGKIKWLLPTGTIATTNAYRWIKPHIGDFYKIEFQGTSGALMRALIDVCQVKASVTKADFQAEVMKNLQEFMAFIKNTESTNLAQQQEQNFLKQRNNPFAALQDLREILDIGEPDIDYDPADEFETTDTETLPLSAGEIISHQTAEELIYCLDLLAKDINDPIEQLDAYCFMQLLCHFAGNEETAAYYQVCADYLYTIHMLTTKPTKQRFSAEAIPEFNILQARMEQLGIERYASPLEFYNQIILLLCSQKDKEHLQHLINDDNKVLAKLASYFSMLLYLPEEDVELQEAIYKQINVLLGFKEVQKKTVAPVSVFFGYEGVDREFKSSAFIHPDKKSDETQIMALARVVASFMNTDGGTLYIGVNDNGYLNGLDMDLKMCHYDCDVYLRSVNIGLIRQLGEGKEEQNRYQDYIRCAFHEYKDGRLVLAFRVPPLNEVVKVNGNVYTRSGSSSIIKPKENIKDFTAQRRDACLDSTPCKPEFPTFFHDERQEYIFDESIAATAHVVLPTKETAKETAKSKSASAASAKKKKVTIDIQTSALRPNPLQKKAEMGYTSSFQFVSFFSTGKISCSPSPKIGVWGENDGKVIFSYDTEGNEELLVSVLRSGEVGISNLKKGFSQPNTPVAFLPSLDELMFAAPATKKDYILLIAEKDGEKRYRIISLADFKKSKNIQPKLTMTLSPEKGIYVYAEILHPEQMEEITEEKRSLISFDIYNSGRLWEHKGYKSDVDVIARVCNLGY